jgi:hypothetical protein
MKNYLRNEHLEEITLSRKRSKLYIADYKIDTQYSSFWVQKIKQAI